MANIPAQCIDCQQPFAFTEGEQKFYRERGFDPPKRCAECRRKKKLRMAQGRPEEYR